jgi:pantothenate kinase-related protein Tda10
MGVSARYMLRHRRKHYAHITVAVNTLCRFCRKSMAWKQVMDTVVVGACGPAGGGRHERSQRLTRHMLALGVPAASEVAMRGICSAVLGGFMDAYFTPGE